MLHCFDPIRTLSFWAILVRLTLAVVCGGVIGAERETKLSTWAISPTFSYHRTSSIFFINWSN